MPNDTIDTGLGNFGPVEQDPDSMDTSDLDDVDTSDLENPEAGTPPPGDPNAGSVPLAAKPGEAPKTADGTIPAGTPPAETPEATIQRLQATIDHLNGTMGHLIKGTPPAAAKAAGTNGTAPQGTPPATPPGGLAPERMKDYEGVRDILDYHTEPHFNELRTSHGTLVNVQDQMGYALNAIVDALTAKGIDVPALKELAAVENLQQQIYKTRGVWMPRGEVAMMHRGMQAPSKTAETAKVAAEKAATTARKQAAHNAAHATDGGSAFALPRTDRKPQSRAERIKQYEQQYGGRRL